MTQQSWREALVAYKSPASLALLLLGFAAGLPTMLVFNTLSVWLREAGVARDTIGFASWLGLVYAFKWVWSPMLDQWRLPFVGRLGRRRSWLVFSQVLIALGLLGMALCNPQSHLPWLIGLALLVAFASATQDIAIDAYRLEIAEDSRQAALAACYMTGYRAAILLASAGALILAEWFGSTSLNYSQSAWGLTYALFALLILPGLVTSLLIREPAVDVPIHVNPSRFDFNHQLLSVLLLLILLISLPAMITALLDRAWPRAPARAAHGDLPVAVGTPADPPGPRTARHRAQAAAGGGARQGSAAVRFRPPGGLGDGADHPPRHRHRHVPRLLLRRLAARHAVPADRRVLPVGTRTPADGPGADADHRVRPALSLAGPAAARPDLHLSPVGHGDGVMAGVFYIDMGFSKEVIASVSKVFGVLMTLIGAAAGGC